MASCTYVIRTPWLVLVAHNWIFPVAMDRWLDCDRRYCRHVGCCTNSVSWIRTAWTVLEDRTMSKASLCLGELSFVYSHRAKRSSANQHCVHVTPIKWISNIRQIGIWNMNSEHTWQHSLTNSHNGGARISHKQWDNVWVVYCWKPVCEWFHFQSVQVDIPMRILGRNGKRSIQVDPSPLIDLLSASKTFSCGIDITFAGISHKLFSLKNSSQIVVELANWTGISVSRFRHKSNVSKAGIEPMSASMYSIPLSLALKYCNFFNFLNVFGKAFSWFFDTFRYSKFSK